MISNYRVFIAVVRGTGERYINRAGVYLAQECERD